MFSSEYCLDIPKCNCGREGKYSVGDPKYSNEMSCNKYAQCPPYEELEKNAGELYKDLLALVTAFEDQKNYKEGTKHSDASIAAFESLKKKYLIT
tara:strand:- start:502 stop:786 length:285 start_codon:yes stop_codon:yes gene_type:complete